MLTSYKDSSLIKFFVGLSLVIASSVIPTSSAGATDEPIPEVTTSVETVQPEKENRVGGFRQHQYVRIYTDSEGRIRMDTTQKAPVQLAKNTINQVEKSDDRPQNVNTSVANSAIPTGAINSPKTVVTKPKEIYKDGFRQHSYIKVYKDIDGKVKLDTTSFERPK